MEEELYKTLGDAKCQELSGRQDTLRKMLKLSEGRKSAQVGGAVLEGVARDFIREFLPVSFGIKSGLIFDVKTKKMSPQLDGIVYTGAPLLEFTDVVVVEKEQVKAILEVKSYIDTPTIFGGLKKGAGDRDPDTGLANDFGQKKIFLPQGAKYILFAFELWSSATDTRILERLKDICDSYAIVVRKESKVEQKGGKEAEVYNFDNSVSDLIEWLRNLS